MHGQSNKHGDRHHRIKGDEQRRNEKLRTYSFAITLTIIALIIGASYIASLPQVEHIPDNFQFNQQPWMKYVPNPVEYVVYVNFDAAFAVSNSPQLFGSGALLQLYQLNYSIYPRDAAFEIDIQLPSPLYGGTVNIVRLHDRTLSAVESHLEKTSEALHFPYQGYTVYGLLMKKAADQKLVQGFITLADGYLVLSNDPAKGKEMVQRVLDQFAFNGPNLFDDVMVRRGVYAAGITDQQYVGLYVGMFQTQLNYSKMIVKSVVQDGDGILVTRSILFSSNDVAYNQYGEAHRVYRDASSYRILDSWLVVAYRYPVSRLRPELSGI